MLCCPFQELGVDVSGEINLGDLLVALGTGALAWFTWRLARRTADSVKEAHGLGKTAIRELEIGQEQAAAAQETAREAQRSRVDALAPAVEVSVGWSSAFVTEAPAAAGAEWRPVGGNELIDPLRHALRARLEINLDNFGRVPAHVMARSNDARLQMPTDEVRVDPADRVSIYADVDYLTEDNNRTEPRVVHLTFNVTGVMTQGTFDVVQWTVEVTPVRDLGRGPEVNPFSQLRLASYDFARHYAGEHPVREAEEPG